MAVRKYLLGFGLSPIASGQTVEVTTGKATRAMVAERLVIPEDIAGCFEIRTVMLPDIIRVGDEVKLTVRNRTTIPWYFRLLVWCRLRKLPTVGFTAAIVGEAIDG